jgi:hypothetical protein
MTAWNRRDTMPSKTVLEHYEHPKAGAVSAAQGVISMPIFLTQDRLEYLGDRAGSSWYRHEKFGTFKTSPFLVDDAYKGELRNALYLEIPNSKTPERGWVYVMLIPAKWQDPKAAPAAKQRTYKATRAVDLLNGISRAVRDTRSPLVGSQRVFGAAAVQAWFEGKGCTFVQTADGTVTPRTPKGFGVAHLREALPLIQAGFDGNDYCAFEHDEPVKADTIVLGGVLACVEHIV